MSTAGVRIAIAAMDAIRLKKSQEYLFAFYHAKTCAIDPVQFITGCTLGNSNIVIKDNKNHTLELVRQDNGTGVSVSLKEDILKKMRDCMKLKKEIEKQSDKGSRLKAKKKFEDEFEDVMHLLQNEDDSLLVDITPVAIDINKRKHNKKAR
jgi:formylmethanofuran dehydrogenase subunit E